MPKQQPPVPSSHGPDGRPAASQSPARPRADYPSVVSQLGPMISVLPNKLYLRFHKDKAQTVRDIALHQDAFFLLSAHEQHSDSGPIDIGTAAIICRDLRSLHANPLLLCGRPVICYCYRDPAEQTNAAFALASYTMLAAGRTPEQAWAPFARVEPSPWVKFRDVTHEPSDSDLSILIDQLQTRRSQVAARQAQPPPLCRTPGTRHLLKAGDLSREAETQGAPAKAPTHVPSDFDLSIRIDQLQIRRLEGAARRAQDTEPKTTQPPLLRRTPGGMFDAPVKASRNTCTRGCAMVAQRAREDASG